MESLRTIYLETPVLNELCEQNAHPHSLLRGLLERDAYPVISTQLISELAATFTSRRFVDPILQGAKLFSYLQKFIAAGVPCLKMNKQLLHGEVMAVTGEIREFEITLPEPDYANMADEVRKLAQGNFDARAREFLSSRSNLRNESRNEAAEFARRRPQLKLAPFDQFLASINPIDIVKALIRHLRDEFPTTENQTLILVAAAMLRNPRYRVANTMVRADLYAAWRATRAGTLARDVLDDCYHLVNASYCDIYVTKDRPQADYAPDIVWPTDVRNYDSGAPVSDWLLAVAVGL